MGSGGGGGGGVIFALFRQQLSRYSTGSERSHLSILKARYFLRGKTEYFLDVYSSVTRFGPKRHVVMWSGPAVVAMPKNAILSTVARRVRPRVRGRRLFCFEIRNGKNGIRWFGVSADGRTVEANGTAHSTAAASFVRLFPMQLSSQPASQPTNPLFQAKNRAFY